MHADDTLPLPYHQARRADPTEPVALVTGATGAIGLGIARGLAGQGFAVVLHGRNEAKCRDAVQEVRAAARSDRVWYEVADISRKAEVQALAARWPGPLDVLINNAAVVPRRREETPEGIERQFATNVLGYLWTTQAFNAALRAAEAARVILVASYWAGDLRLDDLEFKKRRYTANEAYRQAKQADRMLAPALAEELRLSGITVNACHPGTVSSNLLHNLGYSGRESADEAARTPIWLATEPEGGRATGLYFKDCAAFPCRFAADETAVNRLLEACLRY